MEIRRLMSQSRFCRPTSCWRHLCSSCQRREYRQRKCASGSLSSRMQAGCCWDASRCWSRWNESASSHVCSPTSRFALQSSTLKWALHRNRRRICLPLVTNGRMWPHGWFATVLMLASKRHRLMTRRRHFGPNGRVMVSKWRMNTSCQLHTAEQVTIRLLFLAQSMLVTRRSCWLSDELRDHFPLCLW